MTHSRHAGAIELAGQWSVTDDCGEHHFEMSLPGDIITGLHSAGRIPEPYWGRNEYGLRWICERGWVLSREIELERTDLLLVLSEVDTVATILVNDALVLETQNAHRTYRADISHAAVPGTNRIEIRLSAVVQECEARQAALPFPVPDHGENSPIRNGNMLRKPQCDFGWDWNIALAPSGVYGAMRLEPAETLRIAWVAVGQEHSSAGVTLTVTAHMEGVATDLEMVSFTFAGVERRVTLPARAEDPVVTAEFRLAEPKLWWPAGQGAQPLYDLTVQLGDSSRNGFFLGVILHAIKFRNGEGREYP